MEQSLKPCFSSSRISTGFSCNIRDSMVAAGRLRCNKTHQQLMAFSTDARSVNGMVIGIGLPAYTEEMTVRFTFFSTEVIFSVASFCVLHVKSLKDLWVMLWMKVLTVSSTSGLSVEITT